MYSVIDCSDLGLFLPESRDTIQGQMAPWHPFYSGVNKIDKVTRTFHLAAQRHYTLYNVGLLCTTVRRRYLVGSVPPPRAVTNRGAVGESGEKLAIICRRM